jgi:hypothetical protein
MGNCMELLGLDLATRLAFSFPFLCRQRDLLAIHSKSEGAGNRTGSPTYTGLDVTDT